MSQQFLKILFVACVLVFSIASNNNKLQLKNGIDPCENGIDPIIHLQFEKDTRTTDFYKLIQFIESKGEFNRLDKKKRLDSVTNSNIVLQKLLCEKKYFKSPIERWVLDDVFSIRFLMTSKKAIKGHPDFFPKFSITQFNFKTEKEKNIAIDKIKEIGWGDPLKKWNDYYIIENTTRIIILESYVTMFGETKNRYGKMIQKEWVSKNKK